MANVTDTFKSTVDQATTASNQAMAAAKEQVAGAANYIADQSKQAVAATGAAVSHAASFVDQQAEGATDALSGGLKSVARTIRQNAPQDGYVGGAASEVAQTFSNAAGYLDREGLAGIEREISTLIKNNPISALMIGIGLGFLLGRK